MVTCKVPLQTSSAFADLNQAVMIALLNGLEHSNVMSAGHENTGYVISLMVNVDEEVLVLPHASLTVNITVVAPVEAHMSEILPKLLDHETFPHKSVAWAPP